MPFSSPFRSSLTPGPCPKRAQGLSLALALVGCTACSLQDYDYLSYGASTAAGSGQGGSGEAGSSGASSSSGGEGGEGGSSGSAGASDGEAGRSTQGGSSSTAGAGPSTGGTSSSGGSTAAGGTDGTCPPYTGTGGSVLTPPSNGFEEDKAGWTTSSSGTVTTESDASACEGTSYVVASGSNRVGGWDGPGVELLAYVEPGHLYRATLAARFDPETAPSSPRSVIMSVSKTCAEANISQTFTRIQQQVTSTGWVRFTGPIDPVLVGCTNLARVLLYVETDDADSALSLNVDDFMLIDITDQSQTGGAGSNGTAGASGNGGTSGASGNGGTSGASGNGGTSGASGSSGT